MKSIVAFLAFSLLFAISSSAGINRGPENPEANILSRDAEFKEMISILIGFSANISLQKGIHALNMYAGGVATEAEKRLVSCAAGLTGRSSLNSFFTHIALLRASVNSRYKFMQDTEQGRQIVKEALLILSGKGKIGQVKFLEEDCMTAFMTNMALCYWMYDQCWLNYNNEGNQCVAGITTCIAGTFTTGQVCFGIF